MRWLQWISNRLARQRRAGDLALYPDGLRIVDNGRAVAAFGDKWADVRSTLATNGASIPPPPFPIGHPRREIERLGQLLGETRLSASGRMVQTGLPDRVDAEG
ncbi:hypothetical protein [Maricaulis maris]|uniref:Uncharacterized protein n=1 Tax=Maricaulis maris TaxID=74318 RepID=A0A495DLA1_9PROT|nr:hypothetical protein [Maricaulis maris]RKR03713.1 hypothetical protein C7435_0150 [Maricaulis maris]